MTLPSPRGTRASRGYARAAFALALVVLAVAHRPAAADPAPGPTTPAAAARKIPLDYTAYDAWNAIRGVRLSDDGAWLAYSLAPEDGDPVLVLRDLANDAEIREPNGIDPLFTADARYVAYAVRAKNAEIHAAERAHEKPDDAPKNGLAILDLRCARTAATCPPLAFARIKRFALPRDAGNDTIAFLAEPSPKASAAPPAAASAAPSASTNAAPSASAAPSATASPNAAVSNATGASPAPHASPTPDELHKPDDGSELTIDDLARGKLVKIEGASDFALSHDGRFVAYATVRAGGRSGGLYLYDVVTAATLAVSERPGHYRNLVAAPQSDRFAFESDAASFAQSAPSYALFTLDAATFAPGAALTPLAAQGSPSLARDFAPSVFATPAFSQDGARLFFGAAAAPTPVPSGTPEPVKVDIWTWHDDVLQSQQRHDAERERKRTYLATADLAAGTVAELGTADLRDVVFNENSSVALGLDDRAYRRAESWTADGHADVYAVSLRDGSRTLLARGVDDAAASRYGSGGGAAQSAALSPQGGYFLAYDRTARAWFAVRLRDRKRVDLTSKLRVAFYDELDDHPAPPPPYGFGGWLAGDREALLLDRYDVWAVDPQTGRARDLTHGYGRAHHLRFRPLQLDPDATSFDPARPLVLSALDDDTKDSGYFVLDPGAGAPRRIVLGPKAYSGLLQARRATRLVTFAQSYEEPRNLWTLPNLEAGAQLARASDANPQFARYRWGRARLISYRSTWGKPLRGVLIVPDGLARDRRAPMLVYFYERFSDELHALPFTTPAPGTSPCLARYVSNGYVVFLPDVAYRTGHPGQSALGSVLPGVDAALAAGYADPKRVGIAGHSWAAYQIAYIITQTDRFRAAEAGAAVTNMTSAYGGIRLESGVVREGQYEEGQSRIGATPWDRPDLYLENSALFHIRSVHTPYLTIANDLDGAVPFSQGIEWITAMRRLGKEAYLFSFDGEDHNLVGREAQKYWTVHLDEFFDHFLLGKPEPAWMSQGVDFLDRGRRDVRSLYGESP